MRLRSTSPSFEELADDDGGAVMLVGLCMACFLIGALWYVIGVGDALVFRDTMQEVTDSAAYTSAVMHAKGMNFVAAMNLLMLGLVVVHVLMGIINDALAVAAVLLAIPTNGGSIQASNAWRQAYQAYGKSFKPIAKALHKAEVTAAYGYPQLGHLKSRQIGLEYSAFSARPQLLNVVAISPSMIGGGSGDSSLHATMSERGVPGPKSPDDKRMALPLEVHKFSDLCDKVASVGASSLREMTGIEGIPGSGALTQLGGSALKMRYCNDSQGGVPSVVVPIGGGGGGQNDDDNGNGSGSGGGAGGVATLSGGSDPGIDPWWGEDGPLHVWNGTRNGASWQEIWGFTLRPVFFDPHERKVGIAQRRYEIMARPEQPAGYMAAAEFYFDCAKKWPDPTCNGDDNAAYSIRWRARIRRLNLDLATAMVQQHAEKFFQSSPKALAAGVPSVPGDSATLRGVVDDIVARFGDLR